MQKQHEMEYYTFEPLGFAYCRISPTDFKRGLNVQIWLKRATSKVFYISGTKIGLASIRLHARFQLLFKWRNNTFICVHENANCSTKECYKKQNIRSIIIHNVKRWNIKLKQIPARETEMCLCRNSTILKQYSNSACGCNYRKSYADNGRN